tara:strand:- start:112 stop:726 length:615 start_codon:yes stop_codon:yes gene_type:complete
MNKLLLILILTFSFQTLSKADDIRDFQIEGMSVGDSLLDYFSEDQIQLFINDDNAFFYKEKKYVAITTHAKNIQPYAEAKDNYEYVGVVIIPTDKKYEIYGISAYLNFHNNIEDCKKKKKEIVSSIIYAFENATKIEEESPHTYDKSGNSISYDTWFNLDLGLASVHCEDWSKKIEKENGWNDKLKVDLRSEKFDNFLINEAYQ